MFPRIHILVGAIISLLIYLIFPITILQTLILFLSSFLIDVDHYLLYVFITKDISLKRSINYYYNHRSKWLKLTIEERREFKRFSFIFHSIECWLILLILAQFHTIFYFILLGIAIHMILDYTEIKHLKEPFYQKFSIVYLYLKNKGKERFG